MLLPEDFRERGARKINMEMSDLEPIPFFNLRRLVVKLLIDTRRTGYPLS